MIAALATVSIHPDQAQFCIMDEGSVMVAAGDHILKKVWKNSMWFLCWAHKLHGVGGVTKATETLNDSLGILFRSPGLVRPSTQAARRRRWRLHHKVEGKTTFPPQVGETRWGSWRDAADWYTATWTPWCSFVHAEVLRKPWKGKEEDTKPILYQIDDLMQKRPAGTQIRLCFVTDHTTALMRALNFAQDDGPTACFPYDKIMDVQADWRDTMHSKTLSPRIEECLKVLKNGENLRTRLLAIVKDLASALDDRLLKEATQLEFFRQMRVLNPANLSDMSTSLADYPLLGLQGVPNVQEDWNVYTRTEKRDIESPEGLVEWWESRQPSAFKDAALFLILLPTSSGAVERFFSMAGTVTDAQHALSDNLRRMRFMAQFNGDIEERLV